MAITGYEGFSLRQFWRGRSVLTNPNMR
jgi:hypothetical protein